MNHYYVQFMFYWITNLLFCPIFRQLWRSLLWYRFLTILMLKLAKCYVYKQDLVEFELYFGLIPNFVYHDMEC